MTIVYDVLVEALSKVGAIDPTETPTADELSSALTSFNEVLDSWATQNLLLYTNIVTSTTANSGVSTYTIGPTGDIVAQRPGQISAAYVTLGGVDFPLEIISQEEYSDFVLKTQPGIPARLIYNPNYPNGTIILWPVPDQTYTLNLLYGQIFTQATSASDTFDMAPGFKKALRLALMWELVDDFPGLSPAQLAKLENDKNKAIGDIKRINNKPQVMRSEVSQLDCSNGGTYVNWRIGY